MRLMIENSASALISFASLFLAITAFTGFLYIAMGSWLFHRFARA